MNHNANIEQVKSASLAKIESINAVEGFDPMPLALEIGNMNDGSVRYRLPVMAQIAWFRLKYPEGRIAVSVKPGKDYFIAEARIYVNYKDPADCFLAEGSASRGFLPDKPTISPREWAQTAAIGMALRNAGFGLQFSIAGESYEDNTLNELAAMNVQETPVVEDGTKSVQNTASAGVTVQSPVQQETPSYEEPDVKTNEPQTLAQPELTPLEKAMASLCPIAKYKDKTLGEMIRIDPSALAYVAKSVGKYGDEIAGYATLICEYAAQQASA